MREGWVKLYRKTLDSKWGRNPEMQYFWNSLLILANHKDGYTKDGTLVKKGQLMVSRSSLADLLRIDQNAVYRKLQALKSDNQIDIQTSNKNTIITIVNWDLYQGDEQQSEQQANSERTASEQRVNTNKNAKNKKNKKNNNKILQASPLSDLVDDQEIKNWLLTGTEKLQQKLLETYKPEYLAEKIEEAYYWQLENRKSGAGTFLSGWIKRDKNPVLKMCPLEKLLRSVAEKSEGEKNDAVFQ